MDLFRVERDTKIRIKYLTAMELGEFSELPADVYARGFLRNYASYLGLDPDEAESEWRRGNTAPTVRTPAVEELEEPLIMAPVGRNVASPAEAGPAPVFKVPGFRLPSIKWPAPKGPDAAPAAAEPTISGSKKAPAAPKKTPAVAKQAIVVPKAAPAEPSILESPDWQKSAFSLGIPAFLRRRGNREAVEPVLGGPQPVKAPGRSLLLQPIHIVLLLLVVVIAGVGLFFGVQATRVLQDPTLTVTAPGQAVYDAPIGATSFRLEGKATRKAEISISWDKRAPMLTQADESGNWHFDVTLHSGNNEFDIFSTDLETTHHSAEMTRVINVPTATASPVPEFLAIDSPSDGAGFRDGNFIVYGTTVAITSVTVTPIYLGPAPSSLPTPKPVKTGGTPTAQPTLMPTSSPTPVVSPTATPKPTPVSSNNPASVAVIPTVDGKFKAQMHLWSGRWKLSVVGVNAQGVATKPVELTVIVTAGSLVVTFDIRGGSVDRMKIWKDGKVVKDGRAANNTTIKITADQSVWFYASAAGRVLVTVNGVPFGRLTLHGGGSWRMTAFGPPTASNDS